MAHSAEETNNNNDDGGGEEGRAFQVTLPDACTYFQDALTARREES